MKKTTSQFEARPEAAPDEAQTVPRRASAQAAQPSIFGAMNAPMLTADQVSNFGLDIDGIANMTFTMHRHVQMSDGSIASPMMAVAHLTMTPQGLRSLRAALDGIELLAKRASGGTKAN
jgi:hypothetical protein